MQKVLSLAAIAGFTLTAPLSADARAPEAGHPQGATAQTDHAGGPQTLAQSERGSEGQKPFVLAHDVNTNEADSPSSDSASETDDHTSDHWGCSSLGGCL